jgi:hypothetical protein
MSNEAKRVLAAAVAFPEEERAALPVHILDTIRATPTVRAQHAAESVERLAAIRRGEIAILSSDAEVEAVIAALLGRAASRKHFSQSLRHKAFAFARRWSRQVTPNTSPERTRER